jgi:SAM-dependent methyltransferase
MKQFARRVLQRAGQLVLDPLERRHDALRQQLVKRLDRLDERVDQALRQAQQNAALLAGGRGRRTAAAGPRGSALPRLASELPEPARLPEHADISGETATLDACPCCGCGEFTEVSEFNRFLTSEQAPDACASRYHYSLCHRCGVVFARTRPIGPRFRTLLDRFEDTLGRAGKQGAGLDLLGSRRLTPEEAARLREAAGRGVFASADGPGLPTVLRDRLAVSAHVEILSSLLTLSAPRVLELRPRFGAIGAAIRRLFGGETFALPLFEVQQLIVREVYGTRADARLDYDQFTIPYEGAFDLVVANHMVTHAVRPAEMLAAIRARLAPGGHLYLYNEPDEADFLESGKSMFKTLNPFHLQTFDLPSLLRALQNTGFRAVFSTHYQGNCVVLAEVADPRPESIGNKARARRLARYAAARDRSILMLPEGLRGHFRDEWEAVIARAFDTGLVALDDKGALRLKRS